MKMNTLLKFFIVLILNVEFYFIFYSSTEHILQMYFILILIYAYLHLLS